MPNTDGDHWDPSEEIRLLKQRIEELERQTSESRRAERRLSVRDAVTRALAESSSLAQAAPRILQAVGETLRWQTGAVWTVEPLMEVLRCVEFWNRVPGAATEFETRSRQQPYAKGIGLPGKVWDTGQPFWIHDFSEGVQFSTAPRAQLVIEAGLRSGLGFPITAGDRIAGVIEFFSSDIKEPDADLLEMFRALGSQIGQFVERKKAEDMLNRFFTVAIDMLAVAGFDGYFKVVNPAWERTLGYNESEMCAKPFLEFVHPEDRAATIAQVESLSSGQDTVSFENRYLAKDGSYHWMMWNATPLAQHQLIYAAARDVTERRRAEEKIQRLRVRAEQANRAKSEFLARMSHEIRTPLNVVIGMGDLLNRTSLGPEQQNYVRIFQRAGGTLLTLINDILDLAKVESGRITLDETDFEVASLLEATIDIMSVRAQEKKIDLRCEILPATPPRVRSDPDRLRQVLLNLVSNALKFTDSGTVLLRVRPDSRRRMLRFSVSDSGIGISRDKLDMIFESFTQADASTTRKYGGTGLGLAICKRLVELLGGRIWAESSPGAGATFSFTAYCPPAREQESLPLQEMQSPPVSQPAPRPPSQTGFLRILVADDSEDNRFLVAEYLKDMSGQLDFAENGIEAYEKFRKAPYQLVMMDLQMPGMDGYEATRRIRQWEAEQKRVAVPIIALTASALEGELEKSIEAGCTAYLRKPVRLQTLLDAVTRYTAPLQRIPVPTDIRLRPLIPAYLASRRRDVETILTALAGYNFQAIREIGHKMSGSGGGYGFPQITSLGQAIETAAREKNMEQIRELAGELSRFFDRVDSQDR